MKYKNLLVLYQGGGYDGCFWEYNFFYFDSTGKFHNIFTSGYAGIKTEKQAKDMLFYCNDKKTIQETKKDKWHKFYLDNYNDYSINDIFIYDTTKETDIFDFQNDNSYNLIGGICDFINTLERKLKNETPMFYHCSYCNDKIYPFGNDSYSSYFHDDHNYSGDGGIGINYHSLICENCYFNRCGNCDSIINQSQDNEYMVMFSEYCVGQYIIENKYYCVDCFNEYCNDILQGNIPATISIEYDKNQLNLFNKYSNTEKIKTVWHNKENKALIEEYLKSLGYTE